MSDRPHRLFLDSSVILKYYDRAEEGHDIVRYWIKDHNKRNNLLPSAKKLVFYIPDVVIGESIAVFYRKRAGGEIGSKKDLDNYVVNFLRDSNEILKVVPSQYEVLATDTDAIIKTHDEALEANVQLYENKKIAQKGYGSIGAVDSVIINTALKFQKVYSKMAFVTADQNQEETARRLRLDVYNPLNWQTIPDEYKPLR